MKPIELGIVGIGRAGWGAHTFEIMDKKDKFKIVAACDTIGERRDIMAETYGCHTYSRIEDLIADPEVELVDIATRSCDHYRHARMALDAGKSVLVEKPMSVEYEEAKDLFARSNKPGLPRLFVRHNRRFELVFNETLKIIDSGILGNVYEAGTAQKGFELRDDWQTLDRFGGGLFRNWGPHLVDHCLHMLGAPVKKIYSEFKQVCAGGDSEDHINVRMLGENNRTVSLCITGGAALSNGRWFYAYGDRGAVEAHDKKITLRYIDPEQIVEKPVANPGAPAMSFGKSGTFATETPLRWIEKEWEAEGEDLSVMWTYLYDSYRNGVPYPITDEEALEVIRVLSLIKNSTEIYRME